MPGESDQTKWVGTRKVHPAISDLQAVKENLAWHYKMYGQDCTGWDSLGSSHPDVGEIYVVTNLALCNETSMCDLIIESWINAFLRRVTAGYSYEPGLWMSWEGLLVLENPDEISFQYHKGGAADDIVAMMHGYKIGVY